MRAQQSSQDPVKLKAKRAALEQAMRELEAEEQALITPTAQPTNIFAQGPLRLIDISLDILTAAGSSTERDDSLESLQGGDHDPRQRGFTLQQAELSLMGAVDPYFTGEAHLIWFIDPDGETEVELEEAFLTTTSLPHGLQLEVGQMFTEFGRINPQHPHVWDFLDQPIALSRFFGEDGLRGPGARLGWLAPTPWFLQVHAGVQNARGETQVSFNANREVFNERAIGGRPFVDRDTRNLSDLLYLLRVESSWDLDDSTTLLLGGSALFGPNASGTDGDTQIYGADLLLRHKPEDSFRGSSIFNWQSEFLYRNYEADDFTDPGDPMVLGDETNFADDDLRDWGAYTQVVYGLAPNWQAGLRYEYASGSGRNFEAGSVSLVSHDVDPFRSKRQRLSPLLTWNLTEYSRLRLQYNYDAAKHLDDGHAHSAWLGFEISFGSHPAHTY